MRKIIETIILAILVFICGYLWGHRLLPEIEIVPDVEIITIEGAVKTIENEVVVEKPYALVLEKVDDDWRLDTELSQIPDNMSIFSISHDTKKDWLAPFRVGITIDKKPFICYNMANIKRIELGIGTDFEDLYGDVAYRWRNIAPFVAYSISGKFTAGVSIKIF